tara:strand:- start:12298 stop:12783 length:486 start_codon:yes stop_codon:yes gene_type:complete
MIEKFNLLFLTLFNIGKIKYAPGTFASIAACLIFLVLINFFQLIILFIFTLLIFLYSFIAINTSFNSFDDDDPQEIVVDELVGQMLPLLAFPVYETLYVLPLVYYCMASFVFFRIFDIWKPFPINYVDNNVSGALGIMLDDIFAGALTVITITIILFFIGG